MFTTPSPGKTHEDGDFLKDLNPNSLTVLSHALVEPSLIHSKPGQKYQFERLGYFCLDSNVRTDSGTDTDKSSLVFNRVVTLKDTWAAPVGTYEHTNERTYTRAFMYFL